MSLSRFTHLMEHLYRRHGKRAVSVVTLACFLVSSIAGPAAALPAAERPDTKPFERLQKEFVLPFTLGRITDAGYAGGRKVVIVVQDLHCHPEVQKNIAGIIASLDKRFGIANVYLEGGAGPIDTSWLLSLPNAKRRQAVVAALMAKGRLTGAEYFAVTANRPDLLIGLEDRKAYDENVLRLDRILEHQGDIRSALARLQEKARSLEDAYCGPKNKRLARAIARYRGEGREAAKFYGFLKTYARKNGIDPYAYENLSGYLELLNFERRLRYPKIAAELQRFLVLLKERLPYSSYQAIVEKTENFSRLDELYLSLARLSREAELTRELERDFPDLDAFFRYVSLSQQVNPLDLVREERKLVRDLRLAVSENESEREVVFLADFMQRLGEFYTNRISADDYEYYAGHREEFDLLWDKYADKSDLRTLERYADLVGEYYRVNTERNTFFLRNILAAGVAGTPVPAAPDDELAAALALLEEGGAAVMAVTGGFHTAGLTALLKAQGVSYIVITPNVTQETELAEAVYSRTMEAQARILAQALAPDPGALHIQKLATASLDVIIAELRAAGKVPARHMAEITAYVRKDLAGSRKEGEADVTGTVFTLETMAEDDTCEYTLASGAGATRHRYSPKRGELPPAGTGTAAVSPLQTLGRNVTSLIRRAVVSLEGALSRSVTLDAGQADLLSILKDESVALGDKYFYLLAGAQGEKLMTGGGEEGVTYRRQLERIGNGLREMGFSVDPEDVNLSKQTRNLLISPDADAYGLGTLRISPLTKKLTAVIHRRFFQIMEIVGPLVGKDENELVDEYVLYEGLQYRALNEPASKEYAAYTEYLVGWAKEKTGREVSREELATYRSATNFQSFIRHLAALQGKGQARLSPLQRQLATLVTLLDFADDAVLIDQTIRLHQKNFPNSSDTVIKEAVRIAAARYGNKTFPSGERYLHHALTVARNAAKWGADEMTITAAILHKLSAAESREVFSKQGVRQFKSLRTSMAATVLERMDRLSRISKLPYVGGMVKGLRGGFTLQNYMNMIVRLAEDDQTMLLVFADRLQKIPQTADPEERDYRRQETEHVFVPLAMRLDSYDIAEELRNETFSMDDPDAFNRIKSDVEEYLGTSYEQADLMLKMFKDEITEGLRDKGIEAVVKVRVKTPYSVWEKLSSDRRRKYKGKAIASLKDILGIHIIVDEGRFHETMDFIDSWLATSESGFHTILPKEEDEAAQAEKMKRYKALPVVADRSKDMNRFRYNFADHKERSYELCLYETDDYARLQSGFLDETSVRSLKPHWFYKLGEEVRAENGTYIQRITFSHTDGSKNAVSLSFHGDNVRSAGNFRDNFKALHDSLDGKMYVMFFDDKRRFSVVSLPEGSIPADLAAHLDVDVLDKNYNGMERVFLVKHGENPVRAEKLPHHLAEKPGELHTGDIVTMRAKGAAAAAPAALVVRNAKTPRAVLMEMLARTTPAEKKKLIENGKRMIIKKGSGKIDDEVWKELAYFRRSKGLWDPDELCLAVSLGIIEADEITKFLRLTSQRVVQLIGQDYGTMLVEVSACLSDMGFRVNDFTTEEFVDDRKLFRFVIEQADPSAPAPSNSTIEKELVELPGIESAAVKNTQSLYLSAQALGSNVYSLLVSLYGISTVSALARSLGELLIRSFEKQTMRLGEIARAGYADSVRELRELVSRSPGRPDAEIVVSRNPELIRDDAWAMATMAVRMRTDALTNEKVVGRATLYVHEAFLKALASRAPPERSELLRLLVEHELAEFRALNLPGSDEYRLFTAYLRERFAAPEEQRNQENFHELILSLGTKGTLSGVEPGLAAQTALLAWAEEAMKHAGEAVVPVRTETRQNPEIEAADAILKRMQRAGRDRRILKEGLLALLELTVETPEAWRFIEEKLSRMTDRMLEEGSRDDVLYNLLYAFEIVSDRFSIAPIIVPPEYERTDGPKFRAVLKRLMAEAGRTDLSPAERDQVDRFCKALEEIPGAIAPIAADVRYPNLCGPSAQAISGVLERNGIPARKQVFSGHGFAQTCVETNVAGFKFYVDGTAGLVVTDGRQIAPVVVPHQDILRKRIAIYLSKAEGGDMDKQAVDGWIHRVDLDKETAEFIRQVRDLRFAVERVASAERVAGAAGVLELLQSLPSKVFSMLRSSPPSWRQEYARLIDKYIDASDTRTRELLKRVEVYYRVLRIDDFKRKITDIAGQVNGVPGVVEVYGLGYPFYGRIKVPYRNYTTLKDIDEGRGRLSEFAQRTLPDIDLLLVTEENEEGPWSVQSDMDLRMMELFLQQAGGVRRQWRQVFDRLAPEYNIINKFSEEGNRDPIDLFLEEGKLNVDFVPVAKHVWVNMPVMVLPEDMKTFKIIRDLLFTAAPLASARGDRGNDVPLQFRRNFMLNLMHKAGTPLKKGDIIGKVIEVHPYNALITMYGETLSHVSELFGKALDEAESRGLVVRGADDTYTLTAEGEKFLAYVQEKRRAILDEGYLDMPPYSERMLPLPAPPAAASAEEVPAGAGAAFAAADPRRILVGEAAAQAAELLTPSSPDWMRENVPEAHGRTLLRFFGELGVDGMEETMALNELGMNAVCILPRAPNDDGLPVGKITVTRPDGRKNIRLVAGTVEAGDGRSFGYLYGEGLEPADTVRVAAWLKGLPEHRKREIARLLGLRFSDIDVRIVELNGPVSRPYRGDERLLNGISLLYRSPVTDDAPDRSQTYPGTLVPAFNLPDEPGLRALRLVNGLYLPQILSRNAQSVSRAGTSLGETVMASALRGEDARKDTGIGELKDLVTYFMKKLAPAGMNVMQLLPLTLPGDSSPFAAVDPRAGDYALIDCASVPEVQELVSARDPAAKLQAPLDEKDAVNRERVTARKFDVLHAARARLSGEREARFREYERKEGYWLDGCARRLAAARMLGVPAAAVTPAQVAQAQEADRKTFDGCVDTFRYMQWLFDGQLKDAAARLSLNGGKVHFWTTIGGENFEESLKVIGYWFAAYGFDGVRLSITDPGIAGSPEKLQRIKAAVNRARPGAVVSLVLPAEARSLPDETLAGLGFFRVRSYEEVAQGGKIAPNDVVEMGGTNVRPHTGAAARSGNLIDFYTERLGRAREAVCVLFTLGDLLGDDLTLASPDRQGQERWNYRVPLEGEVNEKRVKAALSGLGEELFAFSAGNRNLSSRRGYEAAAALFKDVSRSGNERTVLQRERQFEAGAVRVREPGLHAALAVYRYLLANPRIQNDLIGAHAAGSDRSFFTLVLPVLQELSALPGTNRKYWQAAHAYVTDLERHARESGDNGTKVRYTMEMFGFVRGLLEQVLENEDRDRNLPPEDATQRAARRALLCAADPFLQADPERADPARMLEKARLLMALNRFDEARTALKAYAADSALQPGYEGMERFLEFVELLNVFSRKTQDESFISSLTDMLRSSLERYPVDGTAPLHLQALYYNALRVLSRIDGTYAGRAAAFRPVIERAYRTAQEGPVTAGALYLLGLSETGDLLSGQEKESLLKRIETGLAGNGGLRRETGAQELDPSLVGLLVNARAGLFGPEKTAPAIGELINPLLDLVLRNGAIPDALPLEKAQAFSSARPVAELLRVLDLFAKPELSSPVELEGSFRNAVKSLDIRSQKAMRGAA